MVILYARDKSSVLLFTPPMTNKQEMIDTIYEEIADKTLSFGCCIKLNKTVKDDTIYKIIGKQGNFRIIEYGHDDHIHTSSLGENSGFSIIGHPIMIGDVLDWLEKNMKVIYNYEGHLGAEISGDILTKRIYKRKPIEEQLEECIKHIYNLVTNK